MTTKHEQFYDSIIQFIEVRNFLSVYKFTVDSKVCPETPPDEWLKTMVFMWVNKWIYYERENGRVSTVVGAYRIKEFDEKTIDTMPETEEGNILFVPFAASKSEDITIFKKMYEKYKKIHPIEEVIFYKFSEDEKFKRFKVKGDTNGKKQDAEFTECT